MVACCVVHVSGIKQCNAKCTQSHLLDRLHIDFQGTNRGGLHSLYRFMLVASASGNRGHGRQRGLTEHHLASPCSILGSAFISHIALAPRHPSWTCAKSMIEKSCCIHHSCTRAVRPQKEAALPGSAYHIDEATHAITTRHDDAGILSFTSKTCSHHQRKRIESEMLKKFDVTTAQHTSSSRHRYASHRIPAQEPSQVPAPQMHRAAQPA